MMNNPLNVINERSKRHGKCEVCEGTYALFSDLCVECYININWPKYLCYLEERQEEIKSSKNINTYVSNLEKRRKKGWSKLNLRTSKNFKNKS